MLTDVYGVVDWPCLIVSRQNQFAQVNLEMEEEVGNSRSEQGAAAAQAPKGVGVEPRVQAAAYTPIHECAICREQVHLQEETKLPTPSCFVM